MLAAALGAAGAAPERLALDVRNGTIRGRVEVARRPAPMSHPSSGTDPVGSMQPEDTDPSQSVVYLERAPLGAFEQPERGHARMDQRNESFVPHVLAITTGTRVDFPNNDRIYHNVFSLSKAGRFDLGRYSVGQSKSIRFDRPGIVRVFCEIHSHMNAFILVFSHPFFAITDADGRYRIADVPPGGYNVIAWSEGVALAPRPVVVSEGGSVELDFAFR